MKNIIPFIEGKLFLKVNGGKGLLFDGAVLKKHESFIYGGEYIYDSLGRLKIGRASCRERV